MAIDFNTFVELIRPALPDLILIFLLVIIAVIGVKVIDHISSKLRRKSGDQLRVKLVSGIIQTIFVGIILIIMLSRIGLTEDFIKLIGLVIGGIVAFSSTSLIINFVGSAIIHLTKPFRLSDIIEINKIQGKVMDVTPIFTVIHTFEKTFVSIPNSTFLKDEVINYSREGFRTRITVSLGYDIDRIKAEELFTKAAHSAHLEDIFVSILALQDSSILYEVNGTCHEPEAIPFIASRLRKAVLDEFNLAKIEIASPTLRLNRPMKKLLVKMHPGRVRKQQKKENAGIQRMVKDTFKKK